MDITIDSFVDAIRQSGLVDSNVIEERLAEFHKTSKPIGGSVTEKTQARDFAKLLVKENALSLWQAKNLLRGRSKGYKIGKYKLLSVLGRGGMGSVYLAEHLVMERRVAIKVLSSKEVKGASYLARFQREAKAVAALDHANIVRAFDVGVETSGETDLHYLIMEYVEGASLFEIVKKRGPLTPIEAIHYIRQAADGLVHAHAAGLVHRDIKPENLLVDKQGVVKILDLGLARFLDEDGESLTVEHNDKVLGTADYLAPEQAVDSHTATNKADFYGLGCTLFFLLAGRPPYNEGTLAQRLIAHQTKTPPPLSQFREDVPASLEDFMLRLMAKHADDRPADAAEVSRFCTEWLASQLQAKNVSGIIPQVPLPSLSNVGSRSSASLSESNWSSLDGSLTATKSAAEKASHAHGQTIAAVFESKSNRQTGAILGGAIAVLLLIGWGIGSFFTGGDAEPLQAAAAPDRVQSEVAADPAAIAAADSGSEPAVPTAPEVIWPDRNLPSTRTPAGESAQADPVAAPSAARVAADGDAITVGPDGNFKTISEAVAHVRETFRPVDDVTTRTIRLAAGHVFRESVVFGSYQDREFPSQVTIESDAKNPATILSTTNNPALQIAYANRLIVRNIILDAGGSANSVKLIGALPNVLLENLKVRGYSEVGVFANGAAGKPGERLYLNGIDFRGNSKNLTGLQLLSKTRPVVDLEIENCRFVGPLGVGIEFVGNVKGVFMRHCTFDRLDTGVLFSGAEKEIIRFMAISNTFNDMDYAYRFDGMPLETSEKFTVAKTLFNAVGIEFGATEPVDASLFESMFSNGGWIGANFTMRPRDEPRGANEYSVIAPGGYRVPDPQFLSTDPESDDYLRPQHERLTNAPNGPEPHYVGAIPGK